MGGIEKTITEMDTISGSIAAAVEQQGAAMGDIARNVAETAQAAGEMTTRINDVSAEAVGTDRQAAEVHASTLALSDAVVELRHAVIHVVRTSTSEVNRRRLPRHAVDLSARLVIAGQADRHVHVCDLSEGGASVMAATGEVLAIAPGTSGTLLLDSDNVRLPCAVCGADDNRLHLAFELEPRAVAGLRPILQRLASPRAA